MIETLYEENYGVYVNIINRVAKIDRDTAEDIVQESFLRAVRNQDQYDENKGRPKTWFNKILYNTLSDYKRKDKDVEVQQHDNLSYEDIVDGIPISSKEEFDGFIQSEIDNVKNKNHRKVLHLFIIKGYTSIEISSQLNISQSNVTTIVNRFKKGLEE